MGTLMLEVSVTQLPHAEGLPLPSYATAGAAGMDLSAASDHDIAINPGARALIPTGIAIALPVGFEAQVRPRSGLALKKGITVLNSPGTIDADYRGEIGVVLINHGHEEFVVKRGDRIAQLVISRYDRVVWQQTETLTETDRGTGGFGSTGIEVPTKQ